MFKAHMKRPLLACVVAAAVVAAAAATASATSQWTTYHPSHAAFVRAADANCATVNKLVAPLGNPTALPAIADKLAIVVPLFTMALRAQDELGSPAGQVSLVRRWMAAMTGYGKEAAAIETAAKAGDAAGVGTANTALGNYATQSATLSKQLGLHVCFQ